MRYVIAVLALLAAFVGCGSFEQVDEADQYYTENGQ